MGALVFRRGTRYNRDIMIEAARKQSGFGMATSGLAAGVATLVSDRQITSTLYPQRFRESIVIEGGCWLWQGQISSSGYARYFVTFSKGNGRRVSAHRWAFEQLYGEVDRIYDLDHLCRVRHCVNPMHLEPVTRSENLRRGLRCNSNLASYVRKTHCLRGHELEGSNLKLYVRDGKITRSCRSCFNAHQRRYSKEKRYL